MKSKRCGETGYEAGAIWLVCLKAITVIFAIGLFSTAVWYRHRVHNPADISAPGTVEVLRPGAGSVVEATGAINGGSIYLFGAEEAGADPRVAAVSSKSGMVFPPGDWKFTQPSDWQTVEEFEAVPIEGPPVVIMSGSKTLAPAAVDQAILGYLFSEGPGETDPGGAEQGGRVAAGPKDQPVVLMGSSKSYALAYGNTGRIRRSSRGGSRVLLETAGTIFTEKIGSLGGEIVITEGETPAAPGKPKADPLENPPVLFSSPKSISTPIFSTRFPVSSDENDGDLLMSSSKIGKVVTAKALEPITEFIRNAEEPSGEAGIFVPVYDKVIRELEWKASLGLPTPRAPEPIEAFEVSRWQSIFDWDESDGQFVPAETVPAGYLFAPEPTAWKFFTVPLPTLD